MGGDNLQLCISALYDCKDTSAKEKTKEMKEMCS